MSNGNYSPGSKAYIIVSNSYVTPVTIVRFSSGFYTLRFEKGGGTKLKKHRVYRTKEEAEKALKDIERARRYHN